MRLCVALLGAAAALRPAWTPRPTTRVRLRSWRDDDAFPRRRDDDALARRRDDEYASAYDDVQEAAERLRAAERRLVEARRSAPRPRPPGARTLIDRSDAGTLLLTVPPAGLGGSTLMGGAFAAAWFSAIIPATGSMLAGGALFGAAFLAPFWLAGGLVLKQMVLDPAKKTELSIGEYAWELSQSLPGGVATREDRGATEELAGADVAVTVITNGVPAYACRLVAGRTAWGLGDGLPREELEWVASEINDQLAQLADSRGERDAMLRPPA